MSLLCRTQKISDEVSYIMIRDRNQHFEISISINNNTYETITNSSSAGDRWIQQLLTDARQTRDEIN